MLEPGDFVRYKSDRKMGHVRDATDTMVKVRLTDGSIVRLNHVDAARVLQVWRGDPKTGAYVDIEADNG